MTIPDPDAAAGASIAGREKRTTSIAITRHGQTRMAQRGIRSTDLDILLAYGAETGPDRIMLTKKDTAKAIRSLKRQIATLERLAGKEVVLTGGCLITAYHRTRPIRAPGRTATRRDRNDVGNRHD